MNTLHPIYSDLARLEIEHRLRAVAAQRSAASVWSAMASASRAAKVTFWASRAVAGGDRNLALGRRRQTAGVAAGWTSASTIALAGAAGLASAAGSRGVSPASGCVAAARSG
jgi:hypothetical protein